MTTQFPISFRRARRDAADAWLERTNPVRGLSIREANAIYDGALAGNYSRLHWLYKAMEEADPVLMTCVERRTAAVSRRGWRVSKTSPDELAERQAQAVREALEAVPDLDEAVEHLEMAFFRGFSFARPVWTDGGRALAGFDLLGSWLFCRRPSDRALLWNGSMSFGDPETDGSMQPVPEGEIFGVQRPRAIDYPLLSVYLRMTLGERNWGRFLERYGIPSCILTMPEMTSKDDVDKFRKAASDIAEALNIAVPYGTGVSMGSEARGADPFSGFIEHQEKLVVLLCTGGTLTSLAESGSGTLAGGAQMDVWDEIVDRDAVRIAAAIQTGVVRPLVSALFPGQPCLVRFELGGDKELSAGEIFELAAKARSAGYRIARADLEKATGYTLEEDQTGFPGMSGPVLNAAEADSAVALPLQNAPEGGGVHLPPPEPPRGLTGLFEAFPAELERAIADEMALGAARAVETNARKEGKTE